MNAIEYLWKDRRRVLGMPLSFTRYRLSEDRYPKRYTSSLKAFT